VRGFRKERKDWDVFIPDRHDGYLSWTDYESNQRLIADNETGKNAMSRSALLWGAALLSGLLRCGHCGRKLHVAYSGADGNTGRYHCRGGFHSHGGDRRISFGGMRIDRDIGLEVIGVCQTICPPISCGVSDFGGSVVAFGIEPDGSGGLPVASFPD